MSDISDTIQETVEQVPTELRAGFPAVQLGREISVELGTPRAVPGEDLRAGFVAGFGVNNVLVAQCLHLPQRRQFGPGFQRLLDRGRRRCAGKDDPAVSAIRLRRR